MAFQTAHYERLVDATGTGGFGDALLDAADQAAGASEVFAYVLDASEMPTTIATSGRNGSSSTRASAYTAQFHHLDPVRPIARKKSAGLRMARLSAREVADPRYRRQCFEHPGLAEKISYSLSREDRTFVISFYRGTDSARCAIDGLEDLAELALPLLRKHVAMLGEESHLPPPARVEMRIARSFPLLSQRERQVCARTLVGMTAEAISLDLNISTTTVLTYRRRAYERYGVSSSQEMMGYILS